MHKLERPIEPICLSEYIAGKDNWHDISPKHKSIIWAKIFEMQGERCAYCESAINQKIGDREIEHFLQKNKDCKVTFLWSNLFGSCKKLKVCGNHKDRNISYKNEDLIKCDIEDPEHFFQFINDGSISIRSSLLPDEYIRAKETLRVFNIDKPLRDRRLASLQGYIRTAESLLDILEILGVEEYNIELEKELCETRDLPFATAIKHLLEL